MGTSSQLGHVTNVYGFISTSNTFPLLKPNNNQPSHDGGPTYTDFTFKFDEVITTRSSD